MSDIVLPKIDWRVVFNRSSPPDGRGWGRVRAAQLEETGRAIAFAAWGQAFNALLIAYVMMGVVPGPAIGLWLLALAVVMLHSLRRQRLLRRRRFLYVSRGTLDRAAYHSTLFAFVWVIPARYFFEFANHGQQLFLCVVTAMMMAGAVVIFAPIPAAAGAYVIVVGVGALHILSTATEPAISFTGLVYIIALLGMVMLQGRSFLQRTWLDLALEERRQTVSLLLREFEDSDADWLWQTGATLAFQRVSPRFARALRRSTEELEGTSLIALLEEGARLQPASGARIGAAISAVRTRESFTDLPAPVRVGDELKIIELSARPRYGPDGRFIGYQGVGSDVTEARRAADRIAHMARHDALTGLPNRTQLLERLDEALAGAAARDGRCAVLLVDLDRFKTINDSLGHVAGDHLLQQVAVCFTQVIGPGITAGRLGGDEFAIVVPDADEAEAVHRLCRDIIEATEGPFYHRDQRLFVGASIGVAVGPADGAGVEEMIRNADLALYRAKDGGGNGVCFYEPSLHARADERRRIELALRAALDSGELSLAYQPVVDAASFRIESFEALLRWSNAELGQIPPAKFIPIAEEMGMLGRIGEWVLRTACAEAAGWPGAVSVAVNVSPRQLQDPGFIVMLMSALSQAGLPPHRLELEVTETVFLDLTAKTQTTLHQIQSLGVKLAMDDFGTGYSSLGYLRKAEFDTLKVDRSFVQSITEQDPESTAIIRAVVALAGSLGMRTVAEGVSTEEQLKLVRSLGCDRIQGYIFAKPLPAVEARALLGRRAPIAPAPPPEPQYKLARKAAGS